MLWIVRDWRDQVGEILFFGSDNQSMVWLRRDLKVTHVEQTTDAGCYGNEIWDKNGYNSACITDIAEILAAIMGFTGSSYRMMYPKSDFKTTDPGCHGNEIWVKMSYNSACTGNFAKMLAPIRGFSGRAIEWRRTNSATIDPVVMVTKFETKKAITRWNIKCSSVTI